MQFHPDRDELTLYLRGNASAPVATSIKQHLMVCDKCVGDSLVVYDELDQARAVQAKRETGEELAPTTALVSAATTTIVVDAPRTWRYEWLAVVPIVIASSLMWTTRVPSSTSAPVRASVAAPTNRPLVAPLPVPTEPASRTSGSEFEGDEFARRETTYLDRNRDQDSASEPQVRETRIAKVFIFATRPHPRTSSDPVLLQPLDPVRVAMRSDTAHKPTALALVASQPYLAAPPPQRPAGFRKVFSVLSAPFRKS